MQTCEVPEFWGLHKNKNGAFPLKFFFRFVCIIVLYYTLYYSSVLYCFIILVEKYGCAIQKSLFA